MWVRQANQAYHQSEVKLCEEAELVNGQSSKTTNQQTNQATNQTDQPTNQATN